MKTLGWLGVVVVAAAPVVATGATLAHEDFNVYHNQTETAGGLDGRICPNAKDGNPIGGQNPPEVGISGIFNWISNVPWAGSRVVVGDLSYPGLSSCGGQSLEVNIGGLWLAARMDTGVGGLFSNFRGIQVVTVGETSEAVPIIGRDDTTIYFSYLFKMTGTSAVVAQNYLQLEQSSSLQTFNRLKIGQNWQETNFTASGTILAPIDEAVHLVVVKIEFLAGPDNVALWFDPVVGQPEAAQTIDYSNTTDMEFNRLFIQTQGNYMSFDELRFGETFDDVVNAPGTPRLGLAIMDEEWTAVSGFTTTTPSVRTDGQGIGCSTYFSTISDVGGVPEGRRSSTEAAGTTLGDLDLDNSSLSLCYRRAVNVNDVGPPNTQNNLDLTFKIYVMSGGSPVEVATSANARPDSGWATDNKWHQVSADLTESAHGLDPGTPFDTWLVEWIPPPGTSSAHDWDWDLIQIAPPPAPTVDVVIDEPPGGWTGVTANNTTLTAVDTQVAGQLIDAYSGFLSAQLDNAAPDQPDIRFSGGAAFSLGQIVPGLDRVNFWYRTDAWSGTWQMQVFLDTPGGLKEVLVGTVDGGGTAGALIADDWWHEATAVLQTGPDYGTTDIVAAFPSLVRLAPTGGPAVTHTTYIDRIRISGSPPTPPPPPVGVLIDEPLGGLGAWTTDILVAGWTTATPINTNDTGDPTQAISGVLSMRLDDVVETPDNVGWPDVRFADAGTFPLSAVKLGSQPDYLTFWYRTDTWAYQFEVQVWVYNGTVATIPFPLLRGLSDGGGPTGELIADGNWHQAACPLGPFIDETAIADFEDVWPSLVNKAADNAIYLWFRPQSGWGQDYSLYIDKIEIVSEVPDPTGACCVATGLGTGTCTITTESQCVDGDWLALASCDACTYCPKPFGDTDLDGDMDQLDFGEFQVCLTETSDNLREGCGCFDRDGDGDVDGGDFLAFQQCALGPAVIVDPLNPPPGCAP